MLEFLVEQWIDKPNITENKSVSGTLLLKKAYYANIADICVFITHNVIESTAILLDQV